jgi:hypothetical protein
MSLYVQREGSAKPKQHTQKKVEDPKGGCRRERESEVYIYIYIYIYSVFFTFELTEYFIHQLHEAHWLTRTRDRVHAEVSKTQPPSSLSVILGAITNYKP